MRNAISMARRRLTLALVALPAARLAWADIEAKRTGGPYVPTPQVVVDEMLRMAKVGPGDFVIDLGSGDGVIVLTAAQKLKARGFGVDIDPELVEQSNRTARQRGIADRAQFFVQDVFQADLAKATVVTLYLLPNMMSDLRGKLYAELKPGTRVVSHDYHFGDWPADEQYTWDVPEKEKVNGIPKATVFLWIVPAKIAGTWQIRVAAPGGPERYDVTLRQSFQSFDGAVNGDGRRGRLAQTRLHGTEITFTLPAWSGQHSFRGRVSGDAMEGSVELGAGKGTARWTAVRVKS